MLGSGCKSSTSGGNGWAQRAAAASSPPTRLPEKLFEHIAEFIESSTVDNPFGCQQRPGSERSPLLCPMYQLDPLACGIQIHHMCPDELTTPGGTQMERLWWNWTRALRDDALLPGTCLENCLSYPQSRAAGGITLVPMVQFVDEDIEILKRCHKLRSIPHDAHEELNSKSEVAAVNNPTMEAGNELFQCLALCRPACCADHQPFACRQHLSRCAYDSLSSGEIHHNICCLEVRWF
jgi:hypothetical protein